MRTYRNLRRRLAAPAGGLILLFLLAGCSDGFNYVTVRGKITLKKDGQPVTAGAIVFMPSGDNKLKRSSFSPINTDGTYEINTDGKTGVPTGSYVVYLRAPRGRNAPPAQFADKYLDMGSALKMEVVANPAPGAYDLVLDER